tara:strand:- start:1294 stop:1452 length:159 start_codon:yes stop_codon:yes gene_type:complete
MHSKGKHFFWIMVIFYYPVQLCGLMLLLTAAKGCFQVFLSHVPAYRDDVMFL